MSETIADQALKRAHQFLNGKSYDGLLLTSRENNRFFSAFTGSDSTLLITSHNRGNYLFTDSRYTEQARSQCPDWKVIEYKRVTDAVPRKIKEMRLTKVAFESRYISYNLYHRFVEALDSAVLIPQERSIDLLRVKKLPEEVEMIEGAAKIAEKAIEKCLPELKPGIRETDFTIELEYQLRRSGSGLLPFDIIVASGQRGALPHGVASDKVIRKNEMITIDFGANNNGYICDTTITVGLGNPSAEMREIYQTVLDAHDAAIAGMKPGMALKDVDALARKYIEKKGFAKFFGHGLGHGVGLAVHEEPSLSPLADGELPEGAVVTVEPGIYIPGTGGVRIEDMAHVTAEGARLITSFPKKLHLI